MKSRKTRNNGVDVLVVEDSPTQAQQLCLLLDHHGYQVSAAPNGKEALEAIQEKRPSLVVSDIVMPEMDGYELCKAIKSDNKLKEIPVILVTTLSDPQDVVRGLECGADNFIRKPYDADYLVSRIEYLLVNLDLRKNQKMQVGVEINLGGQRYFINSERQQILDLLISTYEQAVRVNNELKQREKELAHSNQVLNGLYQIAEGLNRAASEQEVAETALERALEVPGVQGGWISLREGETGFRVAAARNLPPALDQSGALEGDCACRRRVVSGELGAAANILECERLSTASGDTRGLRLHASVPLWLGDDRTLGVMNLAGPGEGLFDDDELKVLHGIGNQVAVALERARLREHLEKLVEERTAALSEEVARRQAHEERVVRLNRLYGVLSGINSTIVRVRETQALFDQACRIAVNLGHFTFAWIGMLDEETRIVTPLARAGRDDGYLAGIRLSAEEDAPGNCLLVAQALTQAKPVVCDDIATDERMQAWRDAALTRGYRSVAVFPLIPEDKPVGVFLLYATETGVFDDEEMRLLVEMAGDISFALDHLRKEERLNYLAYFDAVTGLPNRALFMDRVDQWLNAARREQKGFSVAMLDVERFSRINETFGRQAGDDLLRQLARRLEKLAGETGILARLSADYFGIALPHADGGANVAHALEEVLSCIQGKPFQVGGDELRIAARAGVASYPADGENVEALFHNAEASLKKAKASGDKYLFYAPEFNALIAEKLKLETRLRRALELGQLVLHYQPKVSLADGRVKGLEALLRWNDPETGLVPPAKFIPVMEETGMIVEAGSWALGQAVADCRAWRESNLPSPRVAVNVSQVQLQRDDFVDTMRSMVKSAGECEGGALEIEITESMLMRDIEANIRKLQAIRDMGVEVAIDDFGTGYSSLSYIAKLPVNTLKIDRAFIMNMTRNPDDLSIVSTIISLAHSLNMRVVAEGVETEEQANLLRLLKCDEIQGFLFSPAVPAHEVAGFMLGEKMLPG